MATRLAGVDAGRKTTANQRRLKSRRTPMTSSSNNNFRHIDVSDVITADCRLPDGNKTPAQGQVDDVQDQIDGFQGHVSVPQGQINDIQGHVSVSQGQVEVLVLNGSVRQRDSSHVQVPPHVDQVVSELVDIPADDVAHAAEVTQLMSCDSRCGRHDDGFRGCDDAGKAS